MGKSERKPFESELVNFLSKEYFSNDLKELALHTGYSKQQIEFWSTGQRKPHIATVRYLLASVIAPELRIVCEFFPMHFSTVKEIRSQLAKALDCHIDKPGIYAFYDSMCNLIYIGKATNQGLLAETYQQLRNPLGIVFPKALKKPPKLRWEATSFISAYEVPSIEHLDYPKHIESLILRISKPIGNKILGNISSAKAPKEEK